MFQYPPKCTGYKMTKENIQPIIMRKSIQGKGVALRRNQTNEFQVGKQEPASGEQMSSSFLPWRNVSSSGFETACLPYSCRFLLNRYEFSPPDPQTSVSVGAMVCLVLPSSKLNKIPMFL